MWSAVSTAIFSIALIAAMLPTAASAAATVPGTPTTVTGTPVTNQTTVQVSWVAGSNGGSQITSYTVTASSGGFSCTVTGTPAATTCPIQGNTGTPYTYTVTATNAVGTGGASVASAPVVPGINPGQPSQPTVTATGIAGQLLISWFAPAASGDSAITSYTVTKVTGTTNPTCIPTSATSCTVSGLTGTTAYTYKVKANNANANTGIDSTTSAPGVLPGAKPGEATIGTVVPGNGQLTVPFTAPTTGSTPITGYTLSASPGGVSVSLTDTATSGVLAGLTNGVTYTLVLKATNAFGDSAGTGTATTTAIPGAVPAAPSGVTAASTGTSGALLIGWTPQASLGGGTFTNYVATANNGATCPAVTTVTTTTCTITGLSNGTPYTVTVHTQTSIGTSAESSPSSAAIPVGLTKPATMVAPTAAATGAAGAVEVTFVAPATGGSPITSFTATAVILTGKSCTVTSGTSCTITGLTNATADTFTVTATNAQGTSTASPPSAAATPYTAVGPPTAVTVSGVTGTDAIVSWTAEALGSGIATYKLIPTPAVTGYPTAFVSGATITGLSDGTPYSFVVQSVGSNGPATNVASAAPVAATPSSTTPSAPQSLALARNSTNTNVNVTFTAPVVVAAGSLSYTLTVSNTSTAAVAQTIASFTSGTDVTGLASGTNYTFSLVAKSFGVGGAAATASTTVGILPGAPVTFTGVSTSYATVTTLAADVLTGANAGTVRVHGWNVSGGTAATSFVVNAYVSTTPTVIAQSCTSNVLDKTCDLTGLATGVTYNIGIAGVNAIGTGPEATQIATNTTTLGLFQATTAVGAPGAPTGVSATSNASGQSVITFTAPSNTGGASATIAANGYTVTATNVTTSIALAPQASFTSGNAFVGLQNGVAYTFTVKAINSSTLTGPNSDPSAAATPAAPPAAPTGVTGVAGSGQVVASWIVPAVTNGSAIIGYQVTASPGGSTCTTTGATTCTVSGLVNGSGYTFTVNARNTATLNNGGSVASAPSATVTPAGVPGAPTNVVAVAGNAQATVSFTLPTSNGDSPITVFTVTASPGGASCATTGAVSTSCLVTGLTNGTFYTFSAVATNLLGDSAAGTSAAVQPRAAAAVDTTVNHSFGDVSGLSAKSQTAIAAINNLGITVGTSTTTYSPADSVTREQMALFLSRSVTAIGDTLNTTPTHSFGDVGGLASGSQDAIAAIHNLAITTGTNGGATYSPADSVTREQMAAFLGRTWVAVGGTCDNTVNHSFNDLNGNFADPWVSCIFNLGVTTGTSSTTYSPNALVTREQMALFLFRLVDKAIAMGL